MAEGTLTLKASNIRTQLRKLLHERGNGSLLRAWRSELDSDFSQCVSLEDPASLGGCCEALLRVCFQRWRSDATGLGQEGGCPGHPFQALGYGDSTQASFL